MARETREVTFLFTDIEGSTRLWEQHPEEMAVALMRHDTVVRHAIESHSGKVFKTVGDEFCSAFDSVSNAIAAAVAAQVGLRSQEWNPDAVIRVRMAIHTGEVEARGNDFFGSTVNKVARLLATAHGGQILASYHASENIDHYPDDIRLHDMGLHRLKDLQEAEQIFQIEHPHIERDFPPLRSIRSESTNLPVQLTSFIGRERELGKVKECLHDSRLVTLTGSGGCGKTRLAQQAAAELADDFKDGIWLVELSEVADGALVAGAVARALGIRESANGTLQQDLVDFSRDRTVLILLDNCEHVIESAARISDLILRQSQRVKILATSREPLGLGGEMIYHVPSLNPPNPEDMDWHNGGAVELLSTYDAAKLFVERATAVSSTFALGDQNARSVAQVCYQLDGIPLAIELAAARVKVLPVDQIATRLDDRFRLLTGGSRTALPRQQTLRALIDWSYDLLEDNEKALLRRFSVFAGGWNLESAEEVCAGEDIEGWEVLDLMSRLVDKSLITVDNQPTSLRYGLLQTVRQYALGKLEEHGEEEAFRTNHLRHYRQVAQEAAPNLPQAEWLNRLESERANFRAAIEYAQAHDHEAAVCLVANLWRYWLTHSIFTEGREHLASTLGLTEIDESQHVFARALQGAGVLAMNQNDNVVAREYLERCLSVARDNQHKDMESAALNSLGNIAWKQGDYDLAKGLYEQSLELEISRKDDTGVARTKISLGNVATQRAEYELATTLYSEALDISRRIKNAAWEAATLHNLGDVAWLTGKSKEAGVRYQASYDVREILGDRLGMARALGKLGDVALANDEPAKARDLYNRTLSETRKLGDHLWEAATVADLGDLAIYEGRLDEALKFHVDALAMRQKLDDQYGIADSLTCLGNLHAVIGKLEFAARLYGSAGVLRDKIGAPLPPVEQKAFEKGMEAVRAGLDPSAFDASFRSGAEAGEEAIVAEILAASDQPKKG
jgi:predicted ATPase/class 3 adenylate cyclase